MLYLSAVFLSFFLAFLLVTKKDKSTADLILSFWLAITGLHLAIFYLFFTDQYTIYPAIIVFGMPLPLAQGPFLYLYTRQQTSSSPFNKKLLLHFLPLLLSLLMFAKFYFLSFEQRLEVFKQKGAGFEIQLLINLYAIYLSGIIYITLSLVRLLKFRKNLVNQFSNTEKINFNWLLYLIIWISVIWIVILFIQEDNLIFGAAALFVIWLGYFGIRQVKVFSGNIPPFEATSTEIQNDVGIVLENLPNDNPIDTIDKESTDSPKYQKSTLSDQEAIGIHDRLIKLLDEEKPYTNPDLTLNELAKNLDVHPNYLSQVINSKENRTFYDLINERRVEEFIQLVAKPISKQYTLLALAFECGFNSKASFNRNFKKYKGLTPSDYLKQKLAA